MAMMDALNVTLEVVAVVEEVETVNGWPADARQTIYDAIKAEIRKHDTKNEVNAVQLNNIAGLFYYTSDPCLVTGTTCC